MEVRWRNRPPGASFSLESVGAHTRVKQIGRVHFPKQPVLNQIQAAIVRTQLNNLHSLPSVSFSRGSGPLSLDPLCAHAHNTRTPLCSLRILLIFHFADFIKPLFPSGPSQDCPTREKRGWMGDAQVTAGEANLNFDMLRCGLLP